MVERVGKATFSSWRPWAIGAAGLSMGCAAVLLFFRIQRAPSRVVGDDYEEWWRHREKLRNNGDHRGQHPDLFV